MLEVEVEAPLVLALETLEALLALVVPHSLTLLQVHLSLMLVAVVVDVVLVQVLRLLEVEVARVTVLLLVALLVERLVLTQGLAVVLVPAIPDLVTAVLVVLELLLFLIQTPTNPLQPQAHTLLQILAVTMFTHLLVLEPLSSKEQTWL
jgi:hypothetical protein